MMYFHYFVSFQIDSTSELTGLHHKLGELEKDKEQLVKDLKEAEEQNIQVNILSLYPLLSLFIYL